MSLVNKIVSTSEALSKVKDGYSIMIGGFGLRGCPYQLIEALVKTNKKELTIISNDLGNPGEGLGAILTNHQVKSLIGSYYTWNIDVYNALDSGEITVKLIPQGTFAEAIRAGGVGIPAFYTLTSEGTKLGAGKEIKEFNGKRYVLEHALHADMALIKAHKADKLGNLIYYKTSRNFNPLMAMAANYTIAEVDEIVEIGELGPEEIVTPHVFVDAIVKGGNKLLDNNFIVDEKKAIIAKNIAVLVNKMEGSVLMNLGLGTPLLISNYITNENIHIQSENGMIGGGPLTTGDEVDYQCINAGRQTVKETPGCVYVDSCESFGMIRGGHVDITVLGAFQVDQDGNVANWIIPNGKQLGVGGAMDLIKGAKKVIIAMTHTNKGKPKLVKKCTLPITGFGEADIVVTELGMFYFEDGKIILKKIKKDTDINYIRSITELDFEVSPDLEYMIS